MHDCHGEMSYAVICKVMLRRQNLEDYSTKNIWPDTWSIILELMAIRTKNYIHLIWLDVKSGSTPVGGPVKSGRKRTKEKGRGLIRKLMRI